MAKTDPTFYFNVKVTGWEAGSVFADFCKKNSIDATPSLNWHDPVKKTRESSIRRNRLSKLQVVAVEDFLKKNPNLNDNEIARRMNLPCTGATVWRIRYKVHASQQRSK